MFELFRPLYYEIPRVLCLVPYVQHQRPESIIEIAGLATAKARHRDNQKTANLLCPIKPSPKP